MLLRATDLVVRHHPSLPPVLDRVSLDLAAGEVVAIVGSNGSGKSTLARALAGIVPLEAGLVAGANGASPRVGLVLQDPAAQLIAPTVADDIALGPQHGRRAPSQVAAVVEQQVRLLDLESLWARDPGTLSGGQQQRVAVAATLACDVDVLVLDEPTALLDEPARRAFATRVRDLAAGRAVAWITQEPDEVAACDRVIMLDAGVLVWHGSIAEWLADPAIAATWELDLPAAARIHHALRARGIDVALSGSVPRDIAQLVAELGAGGAHG